MPKKILGEDGLNIVVQQIKKRRTGKQRARMHSVGGNKIPVGVIPRPEHHSNYSNLRKKILTRKQWSYLHQNDVQVNNITLDHTKVYEGPYVIGADSDIGLDVINAAPVQRRFTHSPFATIPILELSVGDDEVRRKLNFTSLYTLRKTRYHTAGPDPEGRRFFYCKRYISTSTARMKHKIKVIVNMLKNGSDELEIFEYCSKWLNGAIIGICPLPGQSKPLLWYRITGLSVKLGSNTLITAQCLPLFNGSPFKFPLP